MKKVLPRNPRKKWEVVKLLFKQLKIDKEDCLDRKTSIERISQDTVNAVKTFYQQDDISKMTPGKRDVVMIRSDTRKENVKKRHLYMSIKETYTLFKEENPTTKIGLTKFGYLRPEHVKFSSETPAKMCTCIYHQALNAMHTYLPEIPLYSKSFAEGCLVSSDEKSWYGNCDHNTCSFDLTYEKRQNSDNPAK